MKIGSRIRLTEDHEMTDCIYHKGHEFTIYDSNYRGFDLIDDDGNKLMETAFIINKFELV